MQLSQPQQGTDVENPPDQNPWEPIIKALQSQNPHLPDKWITKTFDSLKVEPNSQLAKVVGILSQRDLDDPVGLWLAGGPGCGKTHLLMATMARLAWFKWQRDGGINGQIKFYNYADLCLQITQCQNDFAFMHKIRSPKYLFIDDLGARKTSDFIQDRIYQIINYRVEHDLPTFVSTNLDFPGVVAEFSERMGSRLKESSAWIELKKTHDHRTKIFINNMEKYKDVISLK